MFYKRNLANLLVCVYVSNPKRDKYILTIRWPEQFSNIAIYWPETGFVKGSKFRQRQQTCCVMLWMFVEEASDLNPSTKHRHHVPVRAKNWLKRAVKSVFGGNSIRFWKLSLLRVMEDGWMRSSRNEAQGWSHLGFIAGGSQLKTFVASTSLLAFSTVYPMVLVLIILWTMWTRKKCQEKKNIYDNIFL